MIIRKPKEFGVEKELQTLIESNLETVFDCQFVASEFSTGQVHGGRIDTLALSEENNPVVIEYKKVESSELINQSLYYLSWIRDHRGDFELAVMRALADRRAEVEVDWSDIRVICIAPGYKKYDLHAVQMMGANIELWRYRLYENGLLYFEEVYRQKSAVAAEDAVASGKDPVMVAAGKKAAKVRATATYDMEQHIDKVPDGIEDIFYEIRGFILELSDEIQEVPKKYYIAYKSTQNFVCMEFRKGWLLLYLKVNPDDIGPLPENVRDVRNIGHYGTGDTEVRVRGRDDIDRAKALIKQSLENVGG